jgi:ABC-type tungstate transport system permease subunit
MEFFQVIVIIVTRYDGADYEKAEKFISKMVEEIAETVKGAKRVLIQKKVFLLLQ